MPELSILVVDDDHDLLTQLATSLESGGFVVATADSVGGAYRQLRDAEPDVVVLDITLDQCWVDGIQIDDGLGLLQEIRRDSDVPIIMLSATSAETVKIIALEFGADDYVTKPFSFGELAARIRAVLRRTRVVATRGLSFAGLELDPDTQEVRLDGRHVRLTLTEFRVLESLVKARGRILSRQQLLDAVHGSHHHGRRRAVDVHVRHLRQKLEIDPGEPRLLLTVRGLGYRLEADQSSKSSASQSSLNPTATKTSSEFKDEVLETPS